MSSSEAAAVVAPREPVRRHLSERQADAVARLTDAAVEEVRASGYEGLTVRNVAQRAGVARATAYTYFASKDHLIAEVFWRRLQDHPPADPDRRRGAAARVTAAIDEITELVRTEPELAAACTTAMLANEPDVARLRLAIGREMNQRLRTALRDDDLGLDDTGSGAALTTLSLALSGAMLQAGMGVFPHAELTERMGDVVATALGSRR